MSRSARCGCVLLAVALLAVAPFAPIATASATNATQSAALPSEPAFVVELAADGSARTALTVTFDLSAASERRAFERLRGNATLREQRTDRFAARLRAIADRAGRDTGRDVTVRNVTVSFIERGDTGVVALSATWDRLASRDGDRLVLREPFDSGFGVDRTFRVVAPDGYELATVTPAPADRTPTAATWAADTTLDGFEAEFAPAGDGAADASADTTGADGVGPNGTAATGTSTGSGPGFGIGAGLLAALGGAALLAARGR